MNELQIFENKEFGSVQMVEKATKSEYLGYVYILECGKLVKIGSTTRPYKRLTSLNKSLGDYGGMEIGRFAISIPHTNYIQNEKFLHEVLKRKRISGTELFNVKFETACAKMVNSLHFIDETEEKEAKSENMLNLLKHTVIQLHNSRVLNLGKMSCEDADTAIEIATRYKEAREEYIKFLEKFME